MKTKMNMNTVVRSGLAMLLRGYRRSLIHLPLALTLAGCLNPAAPATGMDTPEVEQTVAGQPMQRVPNATVRNDAGKASAPSDDRKESSDGNDLDASPSEPVTPSTTADRHALRDQILSCKRNPVQPELDLTEATGIVDLINDDGVSYSCNSTAHERTVVLESLAGLDPNADALYPGALVQGQCLAQGQLCAIGLPRTPGVISMDSVVLRPALDEPLSYSRVMESPSRAQAIEALQDLLGSFHPTATPAKVSYDLEVVNSFEAALSSLGASADWLGGDVRASLESDSTKSYTKMLLKFVQSYYSVAFETPETPEAVFDDKVTAEDAALYMGPDNPPGYVAGVTYGRMLLVFIESEYSEDRVRAALDASIDAILVSGEVSVSSETVEVLAQSRLRVLALGGAAEDVIELIAGDPLAGLGEYLRAGANFSADSPGVPISFVVRYLADNTVARVSFTTDYVVNECPDIEYRRPATAVIHGLTFFNTADDDEDISFAVGLELLRQDGSVAHVYGQSVGETYVEEPGKVGGPRPGINQFFLGHTGPTIDEPIFAVRATVRVQSHDSDGLFWGTQTETFPVGQEVMWDGGGDGQWRLHFSVR